MIDRDDPHPPMPRNRPGFNHRCPHEQLVEYEWTPELETLVYESPDGGTRTVTRRPR